MTRIIMYRKSSRDFLLESFFKGKWRSDFLHSTSRCLNIEDWNGHNSITGFDPSSSRKVEFSSWESAINELTTLSHFDIFQKQLVSPAYFVNFGHDATGAGMQFGGELSEENVHKINLQFEELASALLHQTGLERLSLVSFPFDNYGLIGIDIPRAVAPFHVHCYKAAYGRDYYTQFMSREDMLRLPAYKVTEREDGSVVTQIYPDMMAGESAEALDFMERCAWHFDKYHRVYGSTIYTLPEEWAEGGFFYRQERRLFGPNGLDGVVPQDLGLL